jgi:hypothetical protein
MNVMDLRPIIAIRVAGDPALYAEAPFLEPMKSAAMRTAIKFGKGCTKCKEAARTRAGQQIASAMAALILAESGRSPNRLEDLKVVMRKILNTKFDQLLIRYLKDGKQQVFQF